MVALCAVSLSFWLPILHEQRIIHYLDRFEAKPSTCRLARVGKAWIVSKYLRRGMSSEQARELTNGLRLRFLVGSYGVTSVYDYLVVSQDLDGRVLDVRIKWPGVPELLGE
jgi:hypothetical protein